MTTNPEIYRKEVAQSDTEEKLRNFLHNHAHELGHVRSVLYKCELGI